MVLQMTSIFILFSFVNRIFCYLVSRLPNQIHIELSLSNFKKHETQLPLEVFKLLQVWTWPEKDIETETQPIPINRRGVVILSLWVSKLGRSPNKIEITDILN